MTTLPTPPPHLDTLRELDEWTGHRNMLYLIRLRWLAVAGQIATMACVTWGFKMSLPVLPMVTVLVCLVAFNLASHLRWHEERHVSNQQLLLALGVDMLALTAQLYLSGGTSNPFVFLFLLQISLCALLLETTSTWLMVGFNLLCLFGLALWARPLAVPPDMGQGLASHYVQGLLICFVLNAGLIALLMTRIQDNLRQRNNRLADLRQQAAQREQIVRMGLLASGAAHELGTPLSTLAVILGDWRRLPQFQKQADLLEELDQMQQQLARCKRIVTDILLSAGEARGVEAQATRLHSFLQALVQDWRRLRKVGHFEVQFELAADLPLALDTTVKQMICNVLDNAQEASPDWVGLRVSSDEQNLTLEITDRGPGFEPGVLAKIGTPYQSTKGRQGGLGLFLVFNVATSLGGEVQAGNRPEGGAQVVIQLPLKAIALDDNQSRDPQQP